MCVWKKKRGGGGGGGGRERERENKGAAVLGATVRSRIGQGRLRERGTN